MTLHRLQFWGFRLDTDNEQLAKTLVTGPSPDEIKAKFPGLAEAVEELKKQVAAAPEFRGCHASHMTLLGQTLTMHVFDANGQVAKKPLSIRALRTKA